MIPVVEEDGYFRDINGLGTKVIEMMTQQFNQALVIGYTRGSAVGKSFKLLEYGISL